MILLAALIGWAWAGSVQLDVVSVGGPGTQSERLLLQSTLQRVADFYAHGLGLRLPAQLPIEVTIHRRADGFAAHRDRVGAPSWSSGFFVASRDGTEAVVQDPGDPATLRRVFLHEASHHLLNLHGRSPMWLNEGLAQVVEEASVRGNLLTVEASPRRLAVLAATGRPSVRAIVTNDAVWSEQTARSVAPLYVAAWGLTAMLMSTPEGQRTLAAVLSATRGAPRADAALAAIDRTWPGGVDALERAFAAWAERAPRTITLQSPAAAGRTAPAAAGGGGWTKCPDGKLVADRRACGG